MTQKLYIRTFGCQMNEYDSDKMADVLAADGGYALTDRPENADVILFNTCSVREKAQERVFHDLGRVRALKTEQPDLIIGVGGCVASQEGAGIVGRAPYVDVVFGPQTLHRLPALIRARRATGTPQVDITFPAIEKFDHLPPPRVEGASAFLSIMEGCSKYCTFCVVPYTRGEEVSRPFDDVLTEVADLADQGVMEVTLLGQNVNAYRAPMGDTTERTPILATLLEYVAEVPGIERIRYTTSHPKEMSPRLIEAHGTHRQARLAPAPAGAIGFRSDAGGDEARIHGARVQIHRQKAPARAAGTFAHFGFHRRLSRRDGRRFRADDGSRRGGRFRRLVQLRVQPASGHAGRRVRRSRCRTPVQKARLDVLQARLDAQYRAHSEAMVGTRQRVLVTGPRRRATKASLPPGRTTIASSISRVAATLVGTYADVTITAAQPHSLRGEFAGAH